MNLINILEERSKCSKTQCFRTVSISKNEIVILFSWFFFYFLKTNKFAVLKGERRACVLSNLCWDVWAVWEPMHNIWPNRSLWQERVKHIRISVLTLLNKAAVWNKHNNDGVTCWSCNKAKKWLIIRKITVCSYLWYSHTEQREAQIRFNSSIWPISSCANWRSKCSFLTNHNSLLGGWRCQDKNLITHVSYYDSKGSLGTHSCPIEVMELQCPSWPKSPTTSAKIWMNATPWGQIGSGPARCMAVMKIFMAALLIQAVCTVDVLSKLALLPTFIKSASERLYYGCCVCYSSQWLVCLLGLTCRWCLRHVSDFFQSYQEGEILKHQGVTLQISLQQTSGRSFGKIWTPAPFK